VREREREREKERGREREREKERERAGGGSIEFRKDFHCHPLQYQDSRIKKARKKYRCKACKLNHNLCYNKSVYRNSISNFVSIFTSRLDEIIIIRKLFEIPSYIILFSQKCG